MEKTRAWLSLCLALASISMLTASCGSDEAVGDRGGQGGSGGDAGDPGMIIRGGAGAGGTGGSGGATGGTGGTGGGKAANWLGQACATDADCGDASAFCLPPSSGVPQGLCTAECITDDDCPSNAFCLVSAEVGYGFCLERCISGSTLITDKCHGRSDMACVSLARPTGSACTRNSDCASGEVCDTEDRVCVDPFDACWPTCGGDFHCADGMKCDFESGLCVPEDDLPEGEPIGAECDPNADPDPCSGMCLTFIDENSDPLVSTCTAPCTFGYLEGCGWDGTGPAPAVCLFPFDPNGGVGDIGICAQLCDCNADCNHSGFVCLPFNDERIEDVLGRRGVCEIASLAGDTPQLEECENGAGGAGNGGEGGAPGAAGAGGEPEPTEEGGAGGAGGAAGEGGAPGGGSEG